MESLLQKNSALEFRFLKVVTTGQSFFHRCYPMKQRNVSYSLYALSFDWPSGTLFDRLSACSAIASAARFGAEVAFAVDAHADGVGFHVAFSDHEHGVDFHLLGALDFAVDLVGAFVDFRAHLMSAQFA